METKTYPETNKKFKRRGLVFFFFENTVLLALLLLLILLLSVYIKKIQKISYCFFLVKNTPKLINQQLKNEVKIVN